MPTKRTTKKAPAKAGAPSGMEIFYSVGSTNEDRQRALERFVQDVRDGNPAAHHVLKFIAEGVSAYLDKRDPGWLKKGRGREADSREDFKSWACWYALRCDTELMALPLDAEGAPSDAAEVLHVGVGGKRMRDLARKFDVEPRATDGLLLAIHWESYARHRGWLPVQETYERMLAQYRAWDEGWRGKVIANLPGGTGCA